MYRLLEKILWLDLVRELYFEKNQMTCKASPTD